MSNRFDEAGGKQDCFAPPRSSRVAPSAATARIERKETSHMKPVSIALAATLLGTSGAAAAQSANDARCIVLASGFAKQATGANQQKIAEDTLYFYLGRVGAEVTSAQFKATLDAEAKTLTDANASTLMAQCVSPVKSMVQMLQSAARPPANPEGR